MEAESMLANTPPKGGIGCPAAAGSAVIDGQYAGGDWSPGSLQRPEIEATGRAATTAKDSIETWA